MPLASGVLPTIDPPAIPPFAFSPWHTVHFWAKTTAPWAGVPLPEGRPVPSGRMLMSHAATSASEIRFPSAGDCAMAAPEPKASTRKRAANRSGVDMFDLPFAVDAPARDAVVVLVWECQWVGRPLGLAAQGHEFGAQGLHVPGLVPGAALQDHRPAVPAPGHAKAGERLGQH